MLSKSLELHSTLPEIIIKVKKLIWKWKMAPWMSIVLHKQVVFHVHDDFREIQRVYPALFKLVLSSKIF